MKEIEAGTNPAKSNSIHGQKSRTSIRDGKNLRKKKKKEQRVQPLSTTTTTKKGHVNREQNKQHKIRNILRLNINRNQSAKKEKKKEERAQGLCWGLEEYPFDFKRIEPDSTHIQVESKERGEEQASEEDVGGDKSQSCLRGALIRSRSNSTDIKTNL